MMSSPPPKGGDLLASPATTPGSLLIDEQRFLVPSDTITKPTSPRNLIDDKRIRYKDYIPLAIITISVIEIFFYSISNDYLQKHLRFEPNKLIELWRFLTYMLLHDDVLHLMLNVVMQILFASFLELRHGPLRVLILYLIGGIAGVLGASCVHPDLVIGASGGVYALLISHVADILINYENIKYKTYRCVCIVIIVIFDIAYNLVNIYLKDQTLISWGAHVVAGLTGLFLGLVLFKGDESTNYKWRRILLYLGLLLCTILLISLITLAIQIRKCTPLNVIHTKYIYSC